MSSLILYVVGLSRNILYILFVFFLKKGVLRLLRLGLERRMEKRGASFLKGDEVLHFKVPRFQLVWIVQVR